MIIVGRCFKYDVDCVWLLLLCIVYHDVDYDYIVQPYPVEFTEQPNDLVFFSGSNISLHCETNCAQLESTCAVAFMHNGSHLDYDYVPYDHDLSPAYQIGRRTLHIFNADESVVGRYQCVAEGYDVAVFTDKVVGRPVHLQMAGIAQ